jgi:thiamine biosynthesis protein ThiI
LPVLRPLIGIDKEEIIAIARQIETYEISILPYEDCCVVFSPKHPILKPDYEELKGYFESLALNNLIESAVMKSERKYFDFAYALKTNTK